MPSAAITASELADHLRVCGSEEIALIDGYARAATGTVERRLNRLLVPRSVEVRAASMPVGRRGAALYGGAVTAVNTFTIDGTAVGGSTYAIVGDSPATLFPASDWPIAVGDGLSVRIVYTAGFQEVPDDIRIAVMMLAADMFETRTQHIVGTSVSVNPAVDALLMPWRIMPV
jgi:uncharacterized phiE125 gp8 family phage protein